VPGLRAVALLNRSGADAVFAGAPTSLDQALAAGRESASRPIALPFTAEIHTVSRHTALESPNIAAVLRGSDPALRDQHVLYTAHVDHLGACPAVDGDTVCHGAFDNASGVAVLLEVARAYAALPQPPRRSVAFLFVTGEEWGLQYSFVKRGVPSVALLWGVNTTDPDLDAGAIVKAMLTRLYHTPRDNMSQSFHFDSAATGARLIVLAGYTVAQRDGRPAWTPGDFFGTTFARTAGVR
jgi:Zn-dependent M28 family amino/carboxypeptidase